ncbi:MAG: hypothetical protein WBD47_07440 [Phormidesmis sp.]
MRLAIDTRLRLNLYRLIPLVLMLWPTGNAAADRIIAYYAPSPPASGSYPTYLNEGDDVAGYEVSSGYNLARVHPVKGVVEPHYGVDVATPMGTKLIAPEAIRVVCWWDANGGGEVATAKKASGEAIKMLHLSSCVSGTYTQGMTFARTGNSGLGTGAHLDVRRADRTEPTKADIESFLTGRPAWTSLSDAEIVCAIGAAEGTRNADCWPNQHYSGHIDPGNGVTNLGTFSYQHGASSPAAADKKQLLRLRRAEKEIQAQAQVKWGQPLSKPAIAAALDLWNQSPQAADDFVAHLPSPAPNTAQIVWARSQSYVDPATGQLDAPGLGNDPSKVKVDQSRRTGEVMHQLERASQQRRRLDLDDEK